VDAPSAQDFNAFPCYQPYVAFVTECYDAFQAEPSDPLPATMLKIKLQKQLDKVDVTGEEMNRFITENKIDSHLHQFRETLFEIRRWGEDETEDSTSRCYDRRRKEEETRA
jgi:hypothetical protein